MIKVETMENFPAKSWPFHHDTYHMGTRMGKNVMAMFENHPNQECDYLIVVNMATGERVRLDFNQRDFCVGLGPKEE
jgi:hypothetical protein